MVMAASGRHSFAGGRASREYLWAASISAVVPPAAAAGGGVGVGSGRGRWTRPHRHPAPRSKTGWGHPALGRAGATAPAAWWCA